MSAKKTSRRAGTVKTKAKVLDPGALLLEVGALLAGVGVSLAMLPSGLSPFGPIKAVALAVGACLIATGLALDPQRAVDTGRRLVRVRASLAWPLFLLVGVLATITSLDPEQSLVGHYAEYQGLLLVVASAVAGFGAAALAGNPQAWVRLRRALAVAVLAISALAAYQLLHIWGAVYAARATSTLGNASNLGVYLCLVLPIVFSGARAERGRVWSALCWASLVMGVALLALTLSRGAWVGAVLGALTWIVFEGRRRPIRTRLLWSAVISTGLVLCVVVGLLAVPHASSRLLQAVRHPNKGTLGWRLDVWRTTGGLVASRPFLGFGPASFRYAFPPVRSAVTIVGETRTQIVDDPHNLALSLAVQYGVVGLALFLWLVGGALVATWRRSTGGDPDHSSAALAASMVASIVALQAHFLTLDTWPLLGLLIGWALGLAALPLSCSRTGLRAGASGENGSMLLGMRVGSAATGLAFLFVAFCAAELVLSDASAMEGIRLAQRRAPWSEVRVPFMRAASLAWWEPTARLTLARAATQSLNTRFDSVALKDGETVFAELSRRTPADPLVPAQAAEFYVVAGMQSGRDELTRNGLVLARSATELDPQNGFRWETVGTAFFALGEVQPARRAYERAVKLNPRDVQAWKNLASVYEKLGLGTDAANARRSASKAATLPAIHFE